MPGALITLPLSALIALVGIRALVVTVRHWTGRQPGRPISTWMRSARSLDTEARRAYDRGGLAFGVALLFFAIMIAEVGIFGPHLAQGHSDSAPVGAIAGISFLGFLLFMGLFVIIKYFNWPKMLVPPPLRGEPGVIAGRRERRENLRKPL